MFTSLYFEILILFNETTSPDDFEFARLECRGISKIYMNLQNTHKTNEQINKSLGRCWLIYVLLHFECIGSSAAHRG